MKSNILDKLFNNKKHTEEIKKLQAEARQEPEFIIHKRIKVLYNRIRTLRQNYYDNPNFELVTDEYQGESKYGEVFSFDTAYGRRKICVTENLLAYGTEDLYKQFMNCGDTYTDLYGAFFIIEVLPSIKMFNEPSRVLVKRPVLTDMTPEQIDLAIVEVEQIIGELYEEYLKEKQDKQKYTDYFSTIF